MPIPNKPIPRRKVGSNIDAAKAGSVPIASALLIIKPVITAPATIIRYTKYFVTLTNISLSIVSNYFLLSANISINEIEESSISLTKLSIFAKR